MDNIKLEFKNEVVLRVISGDTGKVSAESRIHNDISDDVLGWATNIYLNGGAVASGNGTGYPACFLLPDGPDWATFSWDRTNPWAPYCYSLNSLYQGVNDGSADQHWAKHVWSFDGARHKLSFRWTRLADDFQLKGLGLTAWDPYTSDFPGGYGLVSGAPSVFVPQTLVTLPTSLLIKGRKGGDQTPDTLEISYYMSLVGVN